MIYDFDSEGRKIEAREFNGDNQPAHTTRYVHLDRPRAIAGIRSGWSPEKREGDPFVGDLRRTKHWPLKRRIGRNLAGRVLLGTVSLSVVSGVMTAQEPLKHSPAATDAAMPETADLSALLGAVCGAENVHPTEGGGSRECGRVPAYPSSCSGLTIDAVVSGHFTAATANEALADYEGCEPHAANFGGTVLLRKAGKAWERIRFMPGLRTGSCLRLPRTDARDALVCLSGWTGQGENDETIDVLVLEAGGEPSSKDVRKFTDTFWNDMLCRAEEVGHSHTFESFESWTRRGPVAGHPPRLEIRYRAQQFMVPQFCGRRSSSANERNPDLERFAGWRAAHTHPGIAVFEWVNDALVPVKLP
jgi:hypothetical protein